MPDVACEQAPSEVGKKKIRRASRGVVNPRMKRVGPDSLLTRPLSARPARPRLYMTPGYLYLTLNPTRSLFEGYA